MEIRVSQLLILRQPDPKELKATDESKRRVSLCLLREVFHRELPPRQSTLGNQVPAAEVIMAKIGFG